MRAIRFVSSMSISILTHSVLSAFADLVQANQRRIYRMWLIAPWLAIRSTGNDALSRISESLRHSSGSLVVITRPQQFPWHSSAVNHLRTLQRREIFECETLHTKLYILECDGFRAAIMGSPNMTLAADIENRELAVEFRTTRERSDEPTAALVAQLIRYASSLRSQDDAKPVD